MNGQISDPVKINKGVRQGAVLSPSIFKCVLALCACVPLELLFFTVILVCLLLHMQMTFFLLPGLALDCFLVLLY